MTTSDPAGRRERLEAYLAEDPDNPALLAEAFDASLAAGDLPRCAVLAERGVANGADASAWALRTARVCLARGDAAAAEALLQPLQAEGHASLAIGHDLALARFLQGDVEGCRRLLDPWMQAGASTRENTQARAAAAALWLRALHRLGRLAQALQWLEEAQPPVDAAADVLGIASLVALDAGRFDVALALADRCLAASPDQAEGLVARGSVAIASADTACAEQLLARALALRPADGRVWSAAGLARMQARDWNGAQQRLAQAVRRMPGHVGSWHALGWTELFRHDLAAAREAFGQALALAPAFAESHGALAMVLALSGQAEEARRSLATARRLDPDNVTGRYARAVLRGEAGPAASRELAAAVLDRPGFFGETLAAWLPAA
ncbi:MAG TPA: tetratricopeptide repeat protein [Ramlibacter sp.]|uniref:tetratricopeptide repeat protein n=1 Tax=Ramlibacter sp. TaxID=1917967 RepID=UPI002D37E725|nr:tetratricopeptide repeat protein [Ramlibacter sp.]HZY18912.1 tetratricopeptide repeat protein [Ramlibacter sp.]